MSLPYARFSQAARVAAESVAEERKSRLHEAAFVGWQVAGSFGGGKDFPAFGEYLRKLGLGSDVGKPVVSAAERDRGKLEQLDALFGRASP